MTLTTYQCSFEELLTRAIDDMQSSVSRETVDDVVPVDTSSIIPNIEPFLFFSMSGLRTNPLKPTSVAEESTKTNVAMFNSEEKERLEALMTKSKLKDFAIEKEAAIPPPLSKSQIQKQRRQKKGETAGEDWFNMKAQTNISEETKQDLLFLKLRSFTNPKRHWKKGLDLQQNPKFFFFEIGTLAPSPIDFYRDGRSKAKMSKQHFVDHILEDQQYKKFAKRKYNEIREKNTGKIWKEKKKQKHAKKKQKTQ